jgi:hypothetical protein
MVTLTSLGSLTIEECLKLRVLPRGIGKLGALKQLTLWGLDKLQEMPDLIGLTAEGDGKETLVSSPRRSLVNFGFR